MIIKRHALLLAACLPLSSQAGTLLFSDNFNAPPTPNLDASDQTGRRGGTLAADVQVRSSRFQHTITDGYLRLSRNDNEGRIRFHDTPGLTVWRDWAAGTTGSTILAEGGLKVEFDWLPVNNTDTNWIAFEAGIAPLSAGEPTVRVNSAATDFGILFRNNGGTQSFDNGTAATNGNAVALQYTMKRHVVITMAFNSFADGTPVVANAWVNGIQVLTNKAVDWNGNAGAFYMELGTNLNRSFFDNLKISTLAPDADTDSDTISDVWEMEKAGNLTDLSNAAGSGPGAGSGDFDGDGLSDVLEYAASQMTAAALIDPKLADSDNDGLSDFAELNPTAPRVITDPTLADTDGDGASDFAESNNADYVDSSNTGTNPQIVDTDGDQFPDGYEAVRGGNPMSNTAGPSNLPAGVSIGVVTDEESTGFSTSETYTHKVSGGGSATVNGVALDALDTANTPPNLIWDGQVGGKNIVAPINNGSWVPANGNITGAGNLSMFGGLAYSGGGDTPNCSHSLTLQNLEVNRAYEFRIFNRMWGANAFRPQYLRTYNGAEKKEVFVLLDRPDIMTGSGNVNSAYYISYAYVAQASTMKIEFTVPRSVTNNPGSYHIYGFSNRVAGPPADTDNDGLGDTWEVQWAGDLTTFGAAPADFDNDGLTDAAEYGLFATYPTLDPKDDDSDNDTLKDGVEIAGAGQRPPTNPTKADTDGDTLIDLIETNTGTVVSATDTGTNPIAADSDNDTFQDQYELLVGSDPNEQADRPALPPGVAIGVLTDDASTGVSVDETYTHKISGGYATTVNGVAFDSLTDIVTPANFTWTASGGKSIVSPLNNNNWVPATGNVTGTGLLDLLGGFTYSNGGANAGSTQRFELSGLTPGLQYEFKLFMRAWDQGGSGRKIAMTFTNGAEVASIWPGHSVQTDRPGNIVADYANQHVAIALTFTYVAQGTSLIFDADVPAGAPVSSGSFHMYGMTNRTAGPPPELLITSVVRASDGSSIQIKFQSRPGRVYAVDFSTGLGATPNIWIELIGDLPSAGVETTFSDSAGSDLQRAQYRIRDVTP